MARGSSTVVAKDAIVITVGAIPPTYSMVDVVNKRTGEPARIRRDEPDDPGDLGVPYTFKPGQRVPKNHPAVKECPGAFVDMETAEAEGLEPS